MKSLKHLLLAKGVAAALIGTAGVAAPAISHASPDDGVICRAGYGAQFSGGNMKCVKHVTLRVPLVCNNPIFPIKRIRVPGIPGDTTNGRDICLRNNGISIDSNDPLTGFTKGQDFVFVAIDQTRVVAAREARERLEEGSLGLPANGVDSSSRATLAVNGGIGAEDIVNVDVSLFTFPVPAPDVIRLQLDIPAIDLPLVLNKTLP